MEYVIMRERNLSLAVALSVLINGREDVGTSVFCIVPKAEEDSVTETWLVVTGEGD